MRAIDWHRFLLKQREDHGKVVFATTELANAAGMNSRALSMALRRMIACGIIKRYAAGRYGLAGAVSAEDLLPSIDSAAYITGMYALYCRQMVMQRPTEITCFTNRRHNRSRVRKTPLGRIVFVCVAGPVYEYPPDGVLASSEQALCDFMHVCRRRGVAAANIATFRNLDRIKPEVLESRLRRYPLTVRTEVERLLGIEG